MPLCGESSQEGVSGGAGGGIWGDPPRGLPCLTPASHELLQVLGPRPRMRLELVHQVKVVVGDSHVLGIAPHVYHLQRGHGVQGAAPAPPTAEILQPLGLRTPLRMLEGAAGGPVLGEQGLQCPWGRAQGWGLPCSRFPRRTWAGYVWAGGSSPRGVTAWWPAGPSLGNHKTHRQWALGRVPLGSALCGVPTAKPPCPATCRHLPKGRELQHGHPLGDDVPLALLGVAALQDHVHDLGDPGGA